MCGKYAKTKSETIEHDKKRAYTSMVILNFRSLYFKPLLEMANPTSIDCFLHNPNPLKRNVDAQPFASICR